MLNKRYFKTNDECEVTFEYANAEAQEVALVCEANQWAPIAMKKAKKVNSPFKVKVRLPKESKFQFRYFIDGENWANDDAADEYWTNEYGENNSVVNTFSTN